MVKAEIDKGAIVFNLEGSEKFLAFRRRVRIPLRKVVGISTETVKPVWLAGRIGTHVPGYFMAGAFWTREGKAFYYVKNGSKCITLKLKNHQYTKVVFEVDDKLALARYLRRII